MLNQFVIVGRAYKITDRHLFVEVHEDIMGVMLFGDQLHFVRKQVKLGQSIVGVKGMIKVGDSGDLYLAGAAVSILSDEGEQ
jgi:hypothetical protein